MALYTFKCDSCARIFDLFIRMGTVTLPCPHCKDGQAEKQPSAPSFSIKGYSAANGYSGGSR